MMESTDEHVDVTGRQDPNGTTDAQGSVPEGNSIDMLREQLAAAQQEAAANQDKYLRSRADMENYKKRIERTYADLAKRGRAALLTKLLGVKDNLERALQYGDRSEASGESVMEGVRLTLYQLDQILTQEGVKPIEAEGQPFNPTTQEAVQSVNDPNVPDHTVVQVVRKGYTYQTDNGDAIRADEVLRPAQVIVSVHKDAE